MRSMNHILLGSVLLLPQAIYAEEVGAADRLASVTALMQNYCVDCHNSVEQPTGLNLEEFDTKFDAAGRASDTGTWEKIARRLRARQMPPAGAKRPNEKEHTEALASLESILDESATLHPRPGRTDSIRRLNRTEYHNAVRDLLAIEVDVNSLLPADQSGHGFDNVTVGDLSPVLLSRYITAAERISRLAVGGPLKSPGGSTMRLPADLTQDSHVEGLPLGTRGGTTFEYQFPTDGKYEIQLRLMRDRDEKIEGLNAQHNVDVLLDRQLVHRFTVSPPKQDKAWQKDYTHLDSHLKKRFQASAGPHHMAVTFPSTAASLSDNARQPFDVSFNRHRHPRTAPALYEVSIVGPFSQPNAGSSYSDTPSRKQIFTRYPSTEFDTEECARIILKRLLRLAYRRPVTEMDLEVPLRFFRERFAKKESGSGQFESAIETALSTILVNPHFLFRAESDPDDATEGTVYQVSDLELATRLSFFLWSSIPDDELLTLAEANRLHSPDILEVQVQRLLKDARSHSLVTNFAAQWLYLRNLESFQPDMRLFPNFDVNLRLSLRRETELLFEDMVTEDHSVLNLISSGTTFLNERLAKHYGIPHIFGSHFRPVDVAEMEKTTGVLRGGLLRHGSVHAVTSYATRTSPTVRGNWILENILGTPPPPPPPNIPALKDKAAALNLTVRERLAEHRSNPACASCHNLMDPIGFALENFDAVGQYRLFDGEQPIDSSGALPDGTEINSVQSLEAGIIERPELFVGTLTEKLLTFALGRGIESYDAAAVRKIVREAADSNYRFSSLVTGIVLSTPFQKRVVE